MKSFANHIFCVLFEVYISQINFLLFLLNLLCNIMSGFPQSFGCGSHSEKVLHLNVFNVASFHIFVG